MADDNFPLTCARCGEPYAIECGYEATKHGFCWACCSDIVEKFATLADDAAFVQLVADRVFPLRSHTAAAHDVALVISQAYSHAIVPR